MKRIIIALFFLIVAVGIFYIAPNYQVNTFYAKDEIRLVIDDKDVTKEIKHPVKIVDGKVMLSSDTIDIYFDKWLHYDEKYDTYISTSDTHIAKMKIDSNEIEIDGVLKNIDVPVQIIDDVLYIPLEELKEVYDIEILNDSKIIVTTEKAEMFTITSEDKIPVRALKKKLSRKVTTTELGEKVDVFRYSKDKEWIWVRTYNGDLGYVSIKDLVTYNIPEYVSKEEIKEKINLVWEYAENYTPNRSNESKIDGIDVIAPTWIYLKDTEGNLRNTVDEGYVTWAHENGYKIWAVLKNDRMGISKTSEVVTDMKARENVIRNLLSICNKYNLDGINIDLEEMKKDDADEFSQFVREISASLRREGYVVSVDVTVPDGSDTWSLCYNRYELAEATDYIVLMAYDQYGSSSKRAGSTATYTWVKSNIEKMVERDDIQSNKLILGIPLYSRAWKLGDDGKVKNTWAVPMKDLSPYLNKEHTEWLDDEKQYYYKKDSTVIWMDEKDSIAQKLSLIEKYNLGGSAYWMWGYENASFWNDIREHIKY